MHNNTYKTYAISRNRHLNVNFQKLKTWRVFILCKLFVSFEPCGMIAAGTKEERTTRGEHDETGSRDEEDRLFTLPDDSQTSRREAEEG